VLESCEIVLESCEIVLESCEIVLKSCEIVLESCEIVLKSCEIVLKSCEIVLESCEIVLKSCEIVLESCEIVLESWDPKPDAHPEKAPAVAVFYGRPLDTVAGLKGPVLGIFGSEDKQFPPAQVGSTLHLRLVHSINVH
jgi:hypothetical protein